MGRALGLDWKWLVWQAGLPLVGPITVSAVAAGMWWASGSGFSPSIRVIVDVSPWALAIYSLTLLCTSMRDMGAQFQAHLGLVLGALAIGAAQLLFYAFLIIKRHELGYTAPLSAYLLSLLLLVCSLVICYLLRPQPEA